MTSTKVNADITTQFDYVNGITDSFSGLIDSSLSSLTTWNSPLYDDTKPSYNLSFKAKADKEAGTLAGTFSINHKATGDYSDGGSRYGDDVANGTLSDSITAAYGTLDKITDSVSELHATKLDKNGEVVSSKSSSSSKIIIKSSSDTLDDKTDDFTHTISSGHTSSYTANTTNTSSTDTAGDVYKSQNLNYSVTNNSKSNSSSDSGIESKSGAAKLSYSNHNLDSANTITANLAYSYDSTIGSDNDSSSINVSSITIKIAADDKTSLSALNFSGVLTSNANGNSISLKSLSLETADLKQVSTAMNITNSDNYDALSSLFNSDSPVGADGVDSFFSEETLSSAISNFQGFNQGNDTITIKTADGLDVNAGDGADVVVGGDGDDSITGGAGSDTLTGGKGLDTFVFHLSDFMSDITDKNGDTVTAYNKSVDTITDFSLKDGDVLDLGDLGQLDFSYNSLTAAQKGGSPLFYINGTVYLNTDTTGDKYTATPIINLTGNPKVNADLSGFDYPVVV